MTRPGVMPLALSCAILPDSSWRISSAILVPLINSADIVRLPPLGWNDIIASRRERGQFGRGLEFTSPASFARLGGSSLDPHATGLRFPDLVLGAIHK